MPTVRRNAEARTKKPVAAAARAAGAKAAVAPRAIGPATVDDDAHDPERRRPLDDGVVAAALAEGRATPASRPGGGNVLRARLAATSRRGPGARRRLPHLRGVRAHVQSFVDAMPGRRGVALAIAGCALTATACAGGAPIDHEHPSRAPHGPDATRVHASVGPDEAVAIADAVSHELLGRPANDIGAYTDAKRLAAEGATSDEVRAAMRALVERSVPYRTKVLVEPIAQEMLGGPAPHDVHALAGRLLVEGKPVADVQAAVRRAIAQTEPYQLARVDDHVRRVFDELVGGPVPDGSGLLGRGRELVKQGKRGEALDAAIRDAVTEHPSFITKEGRAQMRALLEVARRNAGGKRPRGMCLAAVVNDHLSAVPYGKIGRGHIPPGPLRLARQLADTLNKNERWKSLGLKKLPIDNPYEAPPGSIVFVRQGTPGTAHPTAGDVAVKGEGRHFYNDGEMGYGGPQNFRPGNDYVLGVFVPA